jgi:hypothetical protein
MLGLKIKRIARSTASAAGASRTIARSINSGLIDLRIVSTERRTLRSRAARS